MAAPGPTPVPATEAPSSVLLELTVALRKELLRRGEFLPPLWVEEAAQDLKAARLLGVYLPESIAPPGVAFYSLRDDRAYGHVHVAPGEDAVERAAGLSAALVASAPPTVLRLDVGYTGLSAAEEQALGAVLEKIPGGAPLVRLSLEIPVPTFHPSTPLLPPEGTRLVPIRSVPIEAIAELNRRAFAGTPDEPLLDPSPEGGRRVLSEILEGRLGRFLDEASTALVNDEGALVGVLLTAEQSARRGVFHGLAVEPGARRRGDASFLLVWGLRALRALGHSSASLWVTEVNLPALRLYEKVGFRPSGTALLFHYRRPSAAAAQPHRSR